MTDQRLTHAILPPATPENGYLTTWRVSCGCTYVTRDDSLQPGAVVQCSKH